MGSNQRFDVALLSSPDFDATSIRHAKIRVGVGNGQTPMGSRVADVDGDGIDDLVLRQMARQTGVECEDTVLLLRADDPRSPYGPFAISDRVTPTGC